MSTLTESAEPEVAETPAEPAAEAAPVEKPDWYSSGEEWKTFLPEDLKSDPSLGPIKSVDNLAKSYVHSQRMLGADKVTIPGKHATEDEWRQFHTKIGVPEEVDKYQVNGSDSLDKEFFDDFRKTAHSAGILPDQAQKVFDWYVRSAEEAGKRDEEKFTNSQNDGVRELQKEWGSAYDDKVKRAQAAVGHYGDDNLINFLDETGLGNNPNLIKAFSKIGDTLSEDQFKGTVKGELGFTPDEAQRKLNDIFANKDHPYFDKTHPNHKNAMEEVQTLFTKV